MGKKAIGPFTTPKQVSEIAEIIREEGDHKKYMNSMRRMVAGGAVQLFSPTLDDDPFAAARQAPSFSVGYAWSHTGEYNYLGTITNGWAIILHVYDSGSTRSVGGYIESSWQSMKEPTKLAERIEARL